MTILLVLTPEDYVAAMHLHCSLKLSRRFAIYFPFIVAIGMLAVGAWLAVMAIEHDGWSIATTTSEVYFILFAGFLFCGPWLRRRRWKKLFIAQFAKEEDTRAMRYEFDTDMVHVVAGDRSDTKYQWSAFKDFQQSDDMMLLYLAKIRFLMIPTRVLSEDQITELRELIKTHLPASK
jgi:MFS family permease